MNIKKRLFYSLFLFFATELYSDAINKVIYASWDKPDVELLYSLPKEINENTKVLFIIHGNSRDAERSLKQWKDISINKNIILIAPYFEKSSYPNFWTLQMAKSSGKMLKDQSNNLKNSLSSFFTYFQNKLNLKTQTYSVFGYSAGSQFTHRYLLLSQDKKIEKAVLGGAGWYTFLNNEPFPYGIKNLALNNDTYEKFLSTKVLFLLGEDDNDPNDIDLNKSRGAMRQGENRYERAKNYFNSLVIFSEKNSIPFRWRYKVIPELEHNAFEIKKYAANFLLDELDY